MSTRFSSGIFFLACLQIVAGDFVRGQQTNSGTPPATNAPVSLAWPPVLDARNTTTQSTDGRTIERFIHGPRAEWGYPADAKWGYPVAKETGAEQQNHNSFYLVAPKVPRANAPLCVVLHSANRTAYDYLGYASLEKKVDGSDNPPVAITNSPDDFYALYLNSTNDEWWGWHQAQASPSFAQHVNAPPPAELRVLDTIEWVVQRYHIDRNRIYLCGMSMGGCGTLGIGLPHGDVFAAARACVPAGTEYAAYRTNGFVFGAGQAAPPVMVDFSSPVDSWSSTQPAWVQAAQDNQLPLVLGWGPFGHTGDMSAIGKYPPCAVALDFPWLEIRKNEAYPVFTHASSDQQSPWLKAPVKVDDAGQMNAYFRWKDIADTSSRFAMQLWIAHPAIKDATGTMPESATADVTLRRLQQFKVQTGKSYAWRISRNGQPVASGKITPHVAGPLTIPIVVLTTVPVELSLQAEP